MIVNCDVVDCINNKNCKCDTNSINLGLNHDSDGICHIECTNYVCNPNWKERERLLLREVDN